MSRRTGRPNAARATGRGVLRGGRTGRPNAAHATGRGVLRGGRIQLQSNAGRGRDKALALLF
ncbi:hypothetical protein LGQ02_06965 [Bacillus shivajii]|uniref:hypothetical protein n=1 Tax=Bacillus shivajii TaxID=1983719 RepID=UPI001CFC3540|nr:hypothetical protein [Bacillus shivajii]UCZ54496.1 hypothetical protein LGQ02_06965 [Bacillus shivajii]